MLSAGGPQPNDVSGLRILEIGHFHYTKAHLPAQTTLVWTGLKPDEPGLPTEPLTLRSFMRLLRAVRNGHHDVIVVYVEQWAPWHWKHLRRLLSLHPIRTALKLSLIQSLRLVRPGTTVMVLDLTEWGVIHRYNEFLLDKCAIWFKRELPFDRWRTFRRSSGGGFPATRFRRQPRNRRRIEKLRPLSLGCLQPPGDQSSFPDKTSDLFVAVSAPNSSTVRVEGLRQIAALRELGLKIDVAEHRIQPDEFYARMSAAWLTWSPEGFGWDCFRHYEAPLYYSVPVISTPSIIRQFPLIDREHAFYYFPDEPDGLVRTVQQALADKEGLRRTAETARAHVMRHHLWPGRIEDLLAMALGWQEAPGGLILDRKS
jgi:hypothetical protein